MICRDDDFAYALTGKRSAADTVFDAHAPRAHRHLEGPRRRSRGPRVLRPRRRGARRVGARGRRRRRGALSHRRDELGRRARAARADRAHRRAARPRAAPRHAHGRPAPGAADRLPRRGRPLRRSRATARTGCARRTASRSRSSAACCSRSRSSARTRCAPPSRAASSPAPADRGTSGGTPDVRPARRGHRGVMSSAAHRLRLGALRAATLSDDGEVVPLPWLVAGTLSWPAAHAHRVLHAWRAWLEDAEQPVASTARLRRPPRGAATVAVEVALPGGAAGAARRLAPLRALAPEADTVAIAGPELLRPALTAVPAGLRAVQRAPAARGPHAGGRRRVRRRRRAGRAHGAALRRAPPPGRRVRARRRGGGGRRGGGRARAHRPRAAASAGWLPGPPDGLPSRA